MALSEVGPSAEALAELATLDDDLNSEDLDRLEEEAEQEMMEELEREGVQGAAELAEEGASSSSEPEYGPLSREEIGDVIHDLREHGILVCLQRHVVSQPEKVRRPTHQIVPLLLSLGVMLVGKATNAATKRARRSGIESILGAPAAQDGAYPNVGRRSDAVSGSGKNSTNLIHSRTYCASCARRKRLSCYVVQGFLYPAASPTFVRRTVFTRSLRRKKSTSWTIPRTCLTRKSFCAIRRSFTRLRTLRVLCSHSIYPANFQPSPSHYFVKQLEERDKLLRMYSQNIDTLEQKAGISRVLQCHGSFATATCTDPSCGYKVDGRVIRDDLLAKRVPACPKCTARREDADARRRAKRPKTSAMWGGDESEDESDLAYGIMKPDITFFGEKLPDEFDRCVFADREEVDLILVMGTSLKVAPVADLLTHLPSNVPVVLLNRTPITHMAMDVMLLGDSDDIVQYLGKELGWEGSHSDAQPERVGERCVAFLTQPCVQVSWCRRRVVRRSAGRARRGRERRGARKRRCRTRRSGHPLYPHRICGHALVSNIRSTHYTTSCIFLVNLRAGKKLCKMSIPHCPLRGASSGSASPGRKERR